MRTPISGAQFGRDVKLVQKRGEDMATLREVILLLVEGKPLPARYKDHPLSGERSHFRDCHIEPKWLLTYLFGFEPRRPRHSFQGFPGLFRACSILIGGNDSRNFAPP